MHKGFRYGFLLAAGVAIPVLTNGCSAISDAQNGLCCKGYEPGTDMSTPMPNGSARFGKLDVSVSGQFVAFAQASGNHFGLFTVGVLAQDHELVATQARHGVAFAHAGQQPLCHLPQQVCQYRQFSRLSTHARQRRGDAICHPERSGARWRQHE